MSADDQPNTDDLLETCNQAVVSCAGVKFQERLARWIIKLRRKIIDK